MADSAAFSTPASAVVRADDVLRVNVPQAVGGKTVFGQLTVASAGQVGYITAYGCDDGIPRDGGGSISKSDLNYNGPASPVASNRLIVKADQDGDVCFYTLHTVEIIVDVNGVTDTGITPTPNQRTDTRGGSPTDNCDNPPESDLRLTVRTDLPLSHPQIRYFVCGIHAGAAALSGGPTELLLIAYEDQEELAKQTAAFTGSPIEQVRQWFVTSEAIAFSGRAIAWNPTLARARRGIEEDFSFKIGAHEWYHTYSAHIFNVAGQPRATERFLRDEPTWLTEGTAEWFALEQATIYGYGALSQRLRDAGARYGAPRFNGLENWETSEGFQSAPNYEMLPHVGDVLVGESARADFLRTYWEARAVTTEPWQTTFASVFHIEVPEFYAKVRDHMRNIAP